MLGIPPHSFWRHQFPALAWAVFIFFLSSIPATVIKFAAPLSLDKAFHASIFFVFCFLLNRAFLFQGCAPSLARYHLLLSFVIVVSYGILDELHQKMIPGRSADYVDAIADGMGGLLCTMYLFVRAKVQASRPLKIP